MRLLRWAAGAEVGLQFGEGLLYGGCVDAVADLLAVFEGGSQATRRRMASCCEALGVGLADIQAFGDGELEAAGEQFEHLLARSLARPWRKSLSFSLGWVTVVAQLNVWSPASGAVTDDPGPQHVREIP
ncbi:hypothetical protein [Actinomadura barringtoniae]|uniref:hypothetical protein n=1 Tax=Actinomadura barringtoniae TaxID=1427535 RepID=UPI001FB66C4A|nr:hypothetical protein [Actinomadura barringtoniae]